MESFEKKCSIEWLCHDVLWLIEVDELIIVLSKLSSSSDGGRVWSESSLLTKVGEDEISWIASYGFFKTIGKRYIKGWVLFRFKVLMSLLRRLPRLYYTWILRRGMMCFIEKGGRYIIFIPSFYIRNVHKACW